MDLKGEGEKTIYASRGSGGAYMIDSKTKKTVKIEKLTEEGSSPIRFTERGTKLLNF